MQQKYSQSFIKQLITGEFIFSFFRVASKPIAFGSTLIVVSSLSLADYGIYKLAFSVFQFFVTFSCEFLNDLLLNEIKVYQAEKNFSYIKKLLKEYFIFRLLMSFVLTALFLIFTYYVGRVAFGGDYLWVKLIAALFLIQSLKAVLTLLLKYYQSFKFVASNIFIYEFSRFSLIAISFLLFGYKTLTMLVGILVLTEIITLVVLLFGAIRAWRKNKLPGSTATLKEISLWILLRRHGKWAALRQVISAVNVNIRPWLVNFFAGAEGVAFYSFALTLLNNFRSIISFSAIAVLMPKEINLKERLVKIYFYGSRYLSVLYSVIFLASIFIVPIVINYFFPKYHDSIILYLIMSPSLIVLGFIVLANRVLYIYKKQKILVLIDLFGFIGSTFVLIPSLALFGTLGAALGFMFSQGLYLFLSLKFLYKEEGDFAYRFADYFKINDYDKRMWQKLLQHLKLFFRRFNKPKISL
jgi:O-antigen/teichoic acid export membrane protein